MTINPLLNSVSAALAQQSQPAQLRANLPQTGVSDTARLSPTNASITATSQPAVQSASLINASLGFAQLGSLLQSAQLGTNQTVVALQQLTDLAQKATVPNNVTGIDSEFQALLAQLDEIGSGTSFNGSSLLDGTFSGKTSQNSAEGAGVPSLSLPDLTAQGLFGSNLPIVTTPEDALNALGAIAQAKTIVTAASSSIEGVQSELNFAAATVDSALANTNAAYSTLNENDLTGASTDNYAVLRDNPRLAAQAQTNNLSGGLLTLLQE